jgi:adenylate cyclase
MEEEGQLFPDIRVELLIAVLVFLLVVLLGVSGGLAPFAARLTDQLFRLRGSLPHDDRVVLIEVDAATDDALARTWGHPPYPPEVYRALLAKLAWAGAPTPPEAVVLDVRPEQWTIGNVSRLSAQLKSYTDTVVFFPCIYNAERRRDGTPTPPGAWVWHDRDMSQRLPHPAALTGNGRWLCPPPALRGHAIGAARVLPIDGDGRVRRTPLGVAVGNGACPELGYAVKFGDVHPAEVDTRVPDTDAAGYLPINYAGALRDARGRLLPPTQRPFHVYSLGTVLAMSDAEVKQAFGEARAGKVVLVGDALPDVTPRTPSPYDPVYHYPVETLAAVTRMHLTQRYLTQVPAQAGWALAAIVAALLGVLLPIYSARRGALVTVIVLAVLFGAGYYLFAQFAIIAPLLPALLTAVSIYPAIMVQRLVREERRRRSLQRHFSRYLSTDLVMQVLDRPGEVSLEAKEIEEVTVLFADIRSFTAWASTRSADAVFGQLNEFLSEMSRIIEDHGGTVDKFIGDEIMALFGAPTALENPARTAVFAALEMQEHLQKLGVQWELEGLTAFQMGVAIHTGPAIVGELGSDVRRNYTAIGTTVNIAARLEEKTKELGVRILATRATLEHAGDSVEFRELGPYLLRGIDQPVLIYEVLERKDWYRSEVRHTEKARKKAM